MKKATHMSKMTDKQKICIECRKCCIDVAFHTAYKNDREDVIDFYTVRGFEVTKERNGHLMIAMNNFPCPQLTPKGCGVYETRPEVCRGFDGKKVMGKECAWYGKKFDRKGNLIK